MPLTLESAIDRALVSAERSSERHLMLSLQAEAGSATRLPINLALVIDTSGSMSGEKIARVREAASLVVRHLSAIDRVALVTYADDVTVVAPSAELTTTAKTDLLYRLSRIEADGSTNLSGGWLAGCHEVARHQSGDERLHRVLLLTDGLANAGITSLDVLVEHARELRQRGVTTSTMGVGADFNEELLEAMARHGGGRFQYVETAKSIPDCVQGELGEMIQIAARKAAIEVAFPAGVRCTGCLNELATEPTRDGIRVHLGDLIAGDARRIVLRLTVEPGSATAALPISALALYVDTATGRGTEQVFPTIELKRADEAAVEAQPTNADVTGEIARLITARAKEEAARFSRRGETEAAVAALANASRELAASPAPAQAEVMEAMISLDSMASHAQQGLSARQIKEMSYQSYLTRESRRRYDKPNRPTKPTGPENPPDQTP